MTKVAESIGPYSQSWWLWVDRAPSNNRIGLTDRAQTGDEIVRAWTPTPSTRTAEEEQHSTQLQAYGLMPTG